MEEVGPRSGAEGEFEFVVSFGEFERTAEGDAF